MSQSVDIMEVVRHAPLFSKLDPTKRTMILNGMSTDCWPRASQVMSAADTLERFFIIVQGRVKVSFFDPYTERELALFLLGPGDAFNLVAMLDGTRQMLIARTLEAVVAVSAPIASWRAWIESEPLLRQGLDCYAARQLRSLTELAAGLSLSTTVTRLARFLLQQSELAPRIGARGVISNLSHEELAQLIGSTRVVVTRLLTRLKREGTIATQRRSIQILDGKRLREYAFGKAASSSRRRRLLPPTHALSLLL